MVSRFSGGTPGPSPPENPADRRGQSGRLEGMGRGEHAGRGRARRAGKERQQNLPSFVATLRHRSLHCSRLRRRICGQNNENRPSSRLVLSASTAGSAGTERTAAICSSCALALCLEPLRSIFRPFIVLCVKITNRNKSACSELNSVKSSALSLHWANCLP